MSSLHLSCYRKGISISSGVPNTDLTIVARDTRTALRRGVVLLRSGDSLAADLIHKVVRASSVEGFPTSKSGRVFSLSHGVF